MTIAKRLLLLVMAIAVPTLLTALSYEAAQFVLFKTHRFIDPEIMRLVTAGEFVIFFFAAVLEARAHWAAASSS